MLERLKRMIEELVEATTIHSDTRKLYLVRGVLVEIHNSCEQSHSSKKEK